MKPLRACPFGQKTEENEKPVYATAFGFTKVGLLAASLEVGGRSRSGITALHKVIKAIT
jgi:hypothetical protein